MDAILQIAQEGGQVSVDHRGTGSSRGTEEVLDHPTSTQAAVSSNTRTAGRRSAPVHLLHDSRGKHRVGSRAGRGRTCISGAASSLLHQRSPRALKDKISSSLEAIVRGTSNRSQAPTLLLRPQSHSSHMIFDRGYSPQQRSYWEDSQMGMRAGSSQHRVPAPHNNKDSGTGRLRIRMD
jgi:hypothetical protein